MEFKTYNSFTMTQGLKLESSNNGEKPNVLDISSPYFLTNSDHPEQNFIGENLLRDKNYGDWENEMTNALFAKNKIGLSMGPYLCCKKIQSN